MNEVILVFKLIRDEEMAHLSVRTTEKNDDLLILNHHYMTSVLASQLAEGIHRHLDKSEQGWIYLEVLAKCLGIEESHLNIQIHRARKQFSEQLKPLGNAEQLIQRRPRQVRLNCQHFAIFKGDSLESSTVELLTNNASTA